MSNKLSSKITRPDIRSYLHLDLSLGNLYDRIFLILFVVDIILRVIWLDQPPGSLIFDEWYYVNVARVILHLPQSVGANGQPPYVNVPQGLDPNHEHTPLAKLLIALSMSILGNNCVWMEDSQCNLRLDINSSVLPSNEEVIEARSHSDNLHVSLLLR